MKGKKKWLCLPLCLLCLAGCGKNDGALYSGSSSDGMVQQVKNQVMDKISEKLSDKQQELTDQQTGNDDPDRQTIQQLADLIGETDEALQSAMGGEGENVQTNSEGEILSRDYTVRLFDYELTDTIALQSGKVVSSYLYLGGEEYEVWQDLLSGSLGKPVQDIRDGDNEISQCVYQLGRKWVTLNSSYGMQYITVSGEAPPVPSGKQGTSAP